jgi:hypothetical protein
MRNLGCIALLAFVYLLDAGVAWGACDFVRHWDDRALSACIDELSNEISVLRLELQAEQTENRVMRGSICLLAMDLKTESAKDLALITCEELEAARKKAAAAKAKKP